MSSRGEKGTLTLYDAKSVRHTVLVYKVRDCKFSIKRIPGKREWHLTVDCPNPMPEKLARLLRGRG